MNNQEITKYVIKALRKHVSLNQITTEVCEKTGMKWDEAETFIKAIQKDHQEEIARGQKPLIFLMAVTFVIIGLTISVSMVVATFNGFMIYFPRMPIPYLGNASIICSGLALAGGGLLGAFKKTD
jgi:hypothetical protein